MTRTSLSRRTAIIVLTTAGFALLSPTATWACGNLMWDYTLDDDGSGPARQLLVGAGLLLGALFGLRRMVRGLQQSGGLLGSLTAGTGLALSVAAAGGYAAAVLPTAQVDLLQWIVAGTLAWFGLSLIGSARAALRPSSPRRLPESETVVPEYRRAA